MSTVEASPRRMTAFTWLGIAAAALVIIVLVMMHSSADQGIKVVAFPVAVEVTNIGTEPIRILDVIINGRDECSTLKLHNPWSGSSTKIDETKFSKNYLHKIWVANGQASNFVEKDGKLFEGGHPKPLSPDPVELKTGDDASWMTSCNSQIVSATITTSKGTATYTFQ